MALFRHNTNDSQSPFDVDDAPAYVAPNADIVPDEEEPTPPASRRRTGVSPRTGRPLRLASVPQPAPRTLTPNTAKAGTRQARPATKSRTTDDDDPRPISGAAVAALLLMIVSFFIPGTIPAIVTAALGATIGLVTAIRIEPSLRRGRAMALIAVVCSVLILFDHVPMLMLEYRIRTKMIFNAAGAWVDPIRRMVDPDASTLVRVSRGSHILLDKSFMPGDTGMLIPKTRDGRVLFAIPWHEMLLVGTTDVEQREAEFDPKVSEEEVNFMIETASGYLEKPITRADVKATFAGLRPLFNPQATGSAGSTAKVSREHAVIPEYGNMITVTGGKWTAYRKMAEHAMLEATQRHLIPARLCVTKDLPIFADQVWDQAALEVAAEKSEEADAKVVEYARYSREYEGARTAEDVLFRRLRLGQMNAERTEALLPKVRAVFEEASEPAGEAEEAVEPAPVEAATENTEETQA